MPTSNTCSSANHALQNKSVGIPPVDELFDRDSLWHQGPNVLYLQKDHTDLISLWYNQHREVSLFDQIQTRLADEIGF
jgi:hypothetical protein